MTSDDSAGAARRMTTTAVRRLSIIEYLLLVLAAVFSIAGGALAAMMLQDALNFSFRPAWMACTLLFFVVPGVIALGRDRRARATNQAGVDQVLPKEIDG